MEFIPSFVLLSEPVLKVKPLKTKSMKTETKQTVKKNLSIIALVFGIISGIQAQVGYGEIRGTVKDELNEPVAFAVIKVLQGTQFIGGTQTDIEGAYVYKPLEAGVYELIIQEAAHQTTKINKIKVTPNEATRVNPLMNTNTIDAIDVTTTMIEKDYTETGVDQNVFQMKTLGSEDILRQASGERGLVNTLLPSMTPEITEGSSGELHVRGGRANTSAYFVDGVRVQDVNLLPGLSIENVTLFTGGVPAAYGDTAGGVVVITTKSYFSGIRDKRLRDARINDNYKEAKQQQQQQQKATNEDESESGM
jgi:hypothetical protein